jgi:hypothetical protein
MTIIANRSQVAVEGGAAAGRDVIGSQAASAPEVLVVGDVHGHLHRLRALLELPDVARRRAEGATVVQLGDLGHFGATTGADDRAVWEAAEAGLVDLVLWGNHDRAVWDRRHLFNGYDPPFPETRDCINRMLIDQRLVFALEVHGWLITHAGLHAQVKFAGHAVDGVDLYDARSIAGWLNSEQAHKSGLMNAISRRRGGLGAYGGILWRDVSEKLWGGVPQVFGHSASSQHVVRGKLSHWWCIDVGGQPGTLEDECLAGIFLPSQEVVKVERVEVP